MIQSSVTKFARHFTARMSLVLLVAALVATDARAADILVTTDADSGAGSLREAMTNAVSGDRIVFDIPGTPTIMLLSDLPAVTGDISFANNNAIDVTIDRNGNGPLDLSGSLVNPTVLVVNTGGLPSPDADIVASAGTTIFGDGAVSGNLLIPGTLAPGADSAAGTIGTLDVTGDVDASTARVELDISASGGTLSNDLINVAGTATVTDAILAPNFIGDQFAIGQQFLVLDATNPIVGTFANQGDAFAIPNSPFLQAVADSSLGADDFGFLIADNGNSFTTVVSGCNQTSAAGLLDQLLASGTPPAAVTTLRNGSGDDVMEAVDQLSGSIYPSLIGGEIIHIQNNLESIRDAIAWHVTSPTSKRVTPWARGYGVSSRVEPDDCQTPGYRQEIGGMELGCGLGSDSGLVAYIFSHLASGNQNLRDVDQRASVDSYRLGGSVAFVGRNIYLIATGGAGVQNYDVRRSLSALDGSTFVESSFDGDAQFGYFETGLVSPWTPYLALHTTRVELDSIVERGDPDFALINNGGSGDSLRGIIGFALAKSNSTSLGPATTRLRFGWLHEYLDESETFVSQVAGGGTPTGSLADQGVATGKDWGFVRMQVEWGMLLGGQFMFAYEGQYNSRSAYNALLGGTGWAY